MQSSKKKNHASLYRRLKGLTQTQVAEILNTGKSNISNMESERQAPSKAYKRVLNIAPNELSDSFYPMNEILNKSNLKHFSVKGKEQHEIKPIPDRDTVLEQIAYFQKNELSPDIMGDWIPPVAGTFDGTDVLMWTSDKNFDECQIKCGEKVPVIPRLSYPDGAFVLYRETRNVFKVGKISDNGTTLLSVSENNHPDICKAEILGLIPNKK